MNKRILVVDDEPSIRESLARHFRHRLFEVETASDGVDALDKLSRTPFRVVVSDIIMPRMDGIELLRRIREECPMTRTIMITGYVTLDNALACLRLGADTCVFKPIQNLSELDEAVDSAFRHHERWERKLMELRGLKEAN
ncbi:MAG TPA: response regulator [Fibrobacteria bacterium]|nr:response regulator [Fibrobacteria bacterium]